MSNPVGGRAWGGPAHSRGQESNSSNNNNNDSSSNGGAMSLQSRSQGPSDLARRSGGPNGPTPQAASSGAKKLVDEGVRQRLCTFFLTCCNPPQAMQSGGKTDQPAGRTIWTQEIDVMMLLQVCPELGDMLYDNTTMLLDLLRAEVAALAQQADPTITAQGICVRMTHVPSNGATVPALPPSSEGCLVTVCGSIVRMSTKRVVPSLLRLVCRKCRGAVELPSSPFNRGASVKERCTRKECKGEELQSVGQVWMDYAECRLQQRTDLTGRLPRSLLVTLDDDLTIMCNVGQLVEVVGILHLRWKNARPNARPMIEPAVWAINVIPMDAVRGMQSSTTSAARRKGSDVAGTKFNPEVFASSFAKNENLQRVSLVRSVCPQLSGLFGPKLSILLAAVGGASTSGSTSGGMHIRSTIHCLFVGDPSTGKSQLLQYAAAIAPRSTSTNGIGSTSAGLTVAATKENGEWVLEPGALVLSDGGVCVIDELRTVSPADRASLHEAMEQQTISVAKAGLVTKLRTVCSVISACNPPFKKNGTAEIGVGGPLLSRFDFVYLLWDDAAEEKDDRIATHILSCSVMDIPSPLAQEDVARYVWWVRSQYAKTGGPLLTDGAADLIGRYYEAQRRRGASPSLSDAVPVTIRLLESMVRITQAHAKLMLHPLCSEYDAAMAILLLERSAHSLKCPLDILGDDIYTSSRVIDDLFLDDSEECLELQKQVLDAVIAVFSRFGSGHSSTPPSNALEESASAQNGYGFGGVLGVKRSQGGGEFKSGMSYSHSSGHETSNEYGGGEELQACSQLLAGLIAHAPRAESARRADDGLDSQAEKMIQQSLPKQTDAVNALNGMLKRIRASPSPAEEEESTARSLRRLEEDLRTPERSERRVVYYSQPSASMHPTRQEIESEVELLQQSFQRSPTQMTSSQTAARAESLRGPSPAHGRVEPSLQPTPRTNATKRTAEELLKSLMFRL